MSMSCVCLHKLILFLLQSVKETVNLCQCRVGLKKRAAQLAQTLHMLHLVAGRAAAA